MEFLGDGVLLALGGAILGIVFLGLGFEVVDEAFHNRWAEPKPQEEFRPVSPSILEPTVDPA